MKNDMKCNFPCNVQNKVAEEISMCTTTQDFKDGNMGFRYLITNTHGMIFFPYLVMTKLEYEIFVDEIENNLFCKPDCESWTYQVSKANDFTEKGKLNYYMQNAFLT